MGMQIKGKTELFKLPNVDLPNVYFTDILGTPDKTTPNPISGTWFRIEKGPEATPPMYEYDEVGVVIEGEINLRDETGYTATVRKGDTFFFPRGSTIAFSTGSYGLAWKSGGRFMARL